MKRLKNVPSDKAFHVYGGGVIHNIYQLADALSSLSEKSFRHHISQGRNDFATWVKDVLEDGKLASSLSSSKSKSSMARAVKKRIDELEHEHMPAHASLNILKSGLVDFTVGLIVGIIIGLILASFI